MSDALDEERAEITALIDTVLERRLGYRCAFAVVWVKADAAPVMAGFSTNVSTQDAVTLLQGMIDTLEEQRVPVSGLE